MHNRDDQIHILISGERGKIIRFPCSKKKLRKWALLSSSTALMLSLVFVLTLFVTLKQNGPDLIATLLRIHPGAEQPAPPVQNLISLPQDEVERLQAKIITLEEQNKQQREQFEQEREDILGSAMDELSTRSKLLEQVFQAVGIIIPQKTKIRVNNNEGSGGPFIEVSPLDNKKSELINRVDAYLKKIDSIPLGHPASGRVTSPFGKRHDPLNGRVSYHEGIDFSGRMGEKIFATADGVVIRAGRLGGYGKYVEIKHHNGYNTAFAHMSKLQVKRGQKVKRGDVIGLVGNSGRSTGPHLHYEIKHEGEPIDPYDYINVASKVKAITPQQDKVKRK